MVRDTGSPRADAESDFLRARTDIVDLDESSTTRMVRMHRDN